MLNGFINFDLIDDRLKLIDYNIITTPLRSVSQSLCPLLFPVYYKNETTSGGAAESHAPTLILQSDKHVLWALINNYVVKVNIKEATRAQGRHMKNSQSKVYSG